MITETFAYMIRATIGLIKNWRLSLFLSAIYALLLSTLYLFVVTREASVAQLLLSFALALAAPLLFFSLQAIAASSTHESGLASFVKRWLTNALRIFLVSLPIIALAVFIFYFLSKSEQYLLSDLTVNHPAAAAAVSPESFPNGFRWSTTLLMSLRYLTLGIILPLTLMQVWISTVETGWLSTIQHVRTSISRAFRAQSVLIYMSGFVLFGVLPYFILRHQLLIQRPWLELSIFVARLALAFLLTLFGWVVTLRALHESSGCESMAHSTEVVA